MPNLTRSPSLRAMSAVWAVAVMASACAGSPVPVPLSPVDTASPPPSVATSLPPTAPSSSPTLTGTLTFAATQLHDGDFPDGYVTDSNTTTLQVRLRQTGFLVGTDGSAAAFEDDGSSLTYSADYTGPGSDPLCDIESHTSASGTFLANAGRISTVVTTAADGSHNPIELDYLFSAAYELDFGACPHETGTEEVTPLGCTDRTPDGVPVSSSGEIFDFGCTTNTLGHPAVSGIWQMTISGTLVRGP